MRILLLAFVLTMSGCATGLKATGMILGGFNGGAQAQQTQNLNCHTYDGGLNYSCQ